MVLGLLETLDVASELSYWLVCEPAPFALAFTVLPEDLCSSLLVCQALDVRHVDIFVSTVRRSVGVSSSRV